MLALDLCQSFFDMIDSVDADNELQVFTTINPIFYAIINSPHKTPRQHSEFKISRSTARPSPLF